MAVQEEKTKAAVAAAEKRDREEQERLEKEEAELLAAEKKKKKPVRYPTEDLDVRIGDKEKKAGMKVKRPVASRIALPFNDTPGTFEQFLLAWNFLVVSGAILSLLRERDQTTLAGGEDAKVLGITIDELTGAMADVGNNWERVPLRSSEGREG
ncbi:hypothetical protein MPER_01214 [Moniliophthora perniciosa FA553]|nr:hypothetical protein MPER_01214 [Moniliophthora perniciosa FA553]